MITTKEFFTLAKSDEVLKIVREHYLRDDIWCGSSKCKVCLQKDAQKVLDVDPPSKSKLYNKPHYIFLDTNAVLDQIDALEEPYLDNIVVTQTVLDEVKHRSSTIYRRLKEIIQNPARKFYVFVNEHHKDVYVTELADESENDRNDRAIRKAAKWYQDHLGLTSLILTDDAENKNKSIEMGLQAFSMYDYVEGCENTTIIEKLSSKRWQSLRADKEGDEIFPPHLGEHELQNGLRDGIYVQGTFYASRDNYLEATVNNDSQSILIQGHESLNRAIDGDTVAVEILPQEKWTAPSNLVVEQDDEETDERKENEIEDKLKGSSKEEKEKQITGRVVGIIRRKFKQYCGILQVSPVPGHTKHLFVPAKRHIPKVRIETRQGDKLSSQRIIVAIDSWPINSRYPQGHFVRALGKIGDKETENEVLLLEHDVPCSNFTEAVLSCLPKLPWKITPKDESVRKDLRDLYICSVDPPGCTDIDDALHCIQLPNGHFEAGVHIADVSHFIRPHTAIDAEAALRSTTVYLVDKRIDMVPELLSSNLCSLRGGVERFAFSCVWELDENAEIVSAKFFKSIILSKAAMTYAEAQAMIDDTSDQGPIANSLRCLNKLAKILKKKRVDNGALLLASPEIRFHVDSETHEPLEVKVKQLLDTNSMVEEFMLLANVTVGKKILEEFPDCALLRRHPAPPPSNYDPLVKAARHQGFEINIDAGKTLSESLDLAVKEDNPYFNTMLRILTTRCMMQAVYFSSGMLQFNEYCHYGLAAPIYTHFTSPIRRYADVIVHRLLAACVGADSTYPDLLDKRKTQDACNNMNYRHRMAQYAGRASVALHTHIFFRGKVEDEEGYILFVRKNAIQVLIPKYGLEGAVYLNPEEKKGKQLFTFNSEDHTQRYGDIILHSFDRVVVQLSLDSNNVQHEKLVMKLVEPAVPGLSVPPLSKK